MSQEILYTSAPQGLKAGSRGFCTVVSTQGMAVNLTDRLESLSGYRHVFMPHDAQAHLNPINFSHVIMSLGGGLKYHVLSRIADAGVDYTQRSNKIAHHVTLEPAEIAKAPGGPGWVLMDPSFCETKWSGKVEVIPRGRLPRTDDVPSAVCAYWRQRTGDAGWGGVLAETARERGGAVMTIIYPASTDCLRLVVEALSLLPPARRWEVTFNTYYTKLPAGLECQWRFVMDGTPEAVAIRRNPHSPKLDLCTNLGKATGGELVDAARTGHVSRASSGTGGRPALPIGGTARPLSGGAVGTLEAPPPVDDFVLEPLAPPKPSPSRPPPMKVDPIFAKKKGLSPVVLMAIALPLVIAFCSVAFFAGIFVAGPGPVSAKPEGNTPRTSEVQSRPDELEVDADAKAAADAEGKAAEDAKAAEKVRKDEEERAKAAEKAKADAKGVADAKAAADAIAAADLKSAAEAELFKQPFADLPKFKDDLFILDLPPKVTAPTTTFKPFAKVYAPSLTACKLKLLGHDVVFPSDRKTLVRIEDVPGVTRTWKIIRLKANELGKDEEIAAFALNKEHELSFKWSGANAAARALALRYCLVELTVGDKPAAVCVLSSPLTMPFPRPTFENNLMRLSLPNLDATSLPAQNDQKDDESDESKDGKKKEEERGDGRLQLDLAIGEARFNPPLLARLKSTGDEKAADTDYLAQLSERAPSVHFADPTDAKHDLMAVRALFFVNPRVANDSEVIMAPVFFKKIATKEGFEHEVVFTSPKKIDEAKKDCAKEVKKYSDKMAARPRQKEITKWKTELDNALQVAKIQDGNLARESDEKKKKDLQESRNATQGQIDKLGVLLGEKAQEDKLWSQIRDFSEKNGERCNLVKKELELIENKHRIHIRLFFQFDSDESAGLKTRQIEILTTPPAKSAEPEVKPEGQQT